MGGGKESTDCRRNGSHFKNPSTGKFLKHKVSQSENTRLNSGCSINGKCRLATLGGLAN